MTLRLEHVARGEDAKARLTNIGRAFASEPGVQGDTIRWLLRELVGARDALEAIRETKPSAEILEIVEEGLSIQLDE